MRAPQEKAKRVVNGRCGWGGEHRKDGEAFCAAFQLLQKPSPPSPVTRILALLRLPRPPRRLARI
eukprot:7162969-Prymnesium_polylepis.1